jgi:hypothetical protein
VIICFLLEKKRAYTTNSLCTSTLYYRCGFISVTKFCNPPLSRGCCFVGRILGNVLHIPPARPALYHLWLGYAEHAPLRFRQMWVSPLLLAFQRAPLHKNLTVQFWDLAHGAKRPQSAPLPPQIKSNVIYFNCAYSDPTNPSLGDRRVATIHHAHLGAMLASILPRHPYRGWAGERLPYAPCNS